MAREAPDDVGYQGPLLESHMTTQPASTPWHGMAIGIAAVAGAFSALVVLMMLADYRLRLNKDPLDSAPYTALKAQLAKEPRNEDLKQQIRLMDLRLREAYFRQRQFTAAGGWLLLGGAATTLAALLWAGSLRKRLPEPTLQPVAVDLHSPIARSARWLVAATGLVLAGAAISLSMTYRSPLPGRFDPGAGGLLAGEATPRLLTKPALPTTGQVGSGAHVASAPVAGRATKPAKMELPKPVATVVAPGDYPSDAEIEANWPRFRGPDGLGVTKHKDIPTTWDVPGGKGVVWRSPVPLPGNSSPVVWKDRVFVTGGNIDERKVFCYSAADGKLLWQRAVASPPGTAAKLKDLPEEGAPVLPRRRPRPTAAASTRSSPRATSPRWTSRGSPSGRGAWESPKVPTASPPRRCSTAGGS